MKKTSLYFLLSTIMSTGIIFGFSSCKEEKEEVTILLPIAGGYIGTENCDGAEHDYTVGVSNTADLESNKVIISHLGDLAPGLKADLDGNKITLPKTDFKVVDGGVTYELFASGSGEVKGDSLTFSFKIGGDIESECTFRGDRSVVNKPAGSTP